jgi:hypothetical protein
VSISDDDDDDDDDDIDDFTVVCDDALMGSVFDGIGV